MSLSIRDQVAARTLDESLIPDRECRHGSRLRTCGWGDCIALRASLYTKATKEGRRDAEPWPGSFAPDELVIAIDLTDSSRIYQRPAPSPPMADPAGPWRAFAVTLVFGALLVIVGLYLSWAADL